MNPPFNKTQVDNRACLYCLCCLFTIKDNCHVHGIPG